MKTLIAPPQGQESFARYVPYSDGRQVIIRRGNAVGHRYGLEQSQRRLQIGTHAVTLVRYRQILSPPVLMPGQKPLGPNADAQYRSESEVVRVVAAEWMIPREPDGFDEAEVRQILGALLDPPAAPFAGSPKVGPRDRRCGRCGKTAALMAITRHRHNGIPTGITYRYECSGCKQSFVTESAGGLTLGLFLGIPFAAAGIGIISSGSLDGRKLAMGFLCALMGLGLIYLAGRRILAALRNPKLD